MEPSFENLSGYIGIMRQPLTFITGNPAKAEQLSRHLDYPVTHLKLELAEIQSLELREVVEHKARAAYQLVGGRVLVEDASLIFPALGRLPGPLIKWFLQELDNHGLCRLLDGKGERSAHAEVMFGLYDGQQLQTFQAKRSGRVAEQPRGERSFGWDPIFIPEGWELTWGEMSEREQAQSSVRRVALAQLAEALVTSSSGERWSE